MAVSEGVTRVTLKQNSIQNLTDLYVGKIYRFHNCRG